MRRISLFVCFSLCLVLSECTPRPGGSIDEDARTRAEDQFDPLGFPQDEEIVTEKEPYPEKEGRTEPGHETRIRLGETEDADSLLPGRVYRVQFFATKYPDEANRVAEMVAEQLSERTYIEYKAPYYWVRVGNCETREESDALLQIMKKLGYGQSWVVEVKVEP